MARRKEEVGDLLNKMCRKFFVPRAMYEKDDLWTIAARAGVNILIYY